MAEGKESSGAVSVVLFVEPRWLDAIVRGEKTVEGRRGTAVPGDWQARVRDAVAAREDAELVFLAEGCSEQVRRRVTAVRQYPGLREYLEREGLAATLPGVETIEKGLAVYGAFWREEDIAGRGIWAFELAPAAGDSAAPAAGVAEP